MFNYWRPDKQLEPFWELECGLSQEEMKYDSRAEFVVEYESRETIEKEWKLHNSKYPDSFYETPEEWVEDWNGLIEQDGQYGRFTNPRSKWDWFQIGGRWTGFFKIKDNPRYPEDIIVGEPGLMTEPIREGFCDSIRLCDIDFEGMEKQRKIDRKKYWDEAFEKYPDKPDMRNFSYGIRENMTEEEYINSSTFSTYAVLKDDEWYEKGKMGWWGMSSDENENWEEEFEKLVNNLPEDTLLTVADCHI